MYEDQMEIAFAGMKADSGDDRVESFPVGANLQFGLICGTNAQGLLVPGAGTQVRGGAVHSHLPSNAALLPIGGYIPTDCASVMTKGHLWMQAGAGAVTQDGPVSFGADGKVANAGTAMPNATFRSAKTTVTNGDIVLVEFHSPLGIGRTAA